MESILILTEDKGTKSFKLFGFNGAGLFASAKGFKRSFV